MKIIGFDGKSLSKMEELWRGIELFALSEPGKHGFVSVASVDYEGLRQSELEKTLICHFASRMVAKAHNQDFVIDHLLDIYFIADWIHVQPNSLKEWETPEFDLLREIDKFLRELGVRVAKSPSDLTFFRGKVVRKTPEEFRSLGTTLEAKEDNKWRKFYTFPDPITQFIEIPGEGVVVITRSQDQNHKKHNPRNIVLLTYYNWIKWDIAPSSPKELPYTSIEWKDGKLFAQTSDNVKLEVNLENGKIE